MVLVKDVAMYIEHLAPKHIAEDWDNVGLLIGDMNAQINGILVTLDVTNDVVDEAISKGINMIVAHHPLIFTAYKSLTEQDIQQALYRKIVKNDINVYVSHTNLDSANGGMNDWLAQAIELDNVEILKVEGEYNGQPYGIGRVGNLKEAITFDKLIETVAKQYHYTGIRYVGNRQTVVKRVAVLGGAGQHYYKEAVLKQADVYITGDITYHVAQDMLYHGLCVIDAGHYIESICKTNLIDYLNQFIDELPIMSSQINTNALLFKA